MACVYVVSIRKKHTSVFTALSTDVFPTPVNLIYYCQNLFRQLVIHSGSERRLAVLTPATVRMESAAILSLGRVLLEKVSGGVNTCRCLSACLHVCVCVCM